MTAEPQAVNAWGYYQEGIHPDIYNDPEIRAGVEGQALAVAAGGARLAGRRLAGRDPEVSWHPQWWAEDWGPLGTLLGWDPERGERSPDAWAIRVLVHLEPVG